MRGPLSITKDSHNTLVVLAGLMDILKNIHKCPDDDKIWGELERTIQRVQMLPSGPQKDLTVTPVTEVSSKEVLLQLLLIDSNWLERDELTLVAATAQDGTVYLIGERADHQGTSQDRFTRLWAPEVRPDCKKPEEVDRRARLQPRPQVSSGQPTESAEKKPRPCLLDQIMRVIAHDPAVIMPVEHQILNAFLANVASTYVLELKNIRRFGNPLITMLTTAHGQDRLATWLYHKSLRREYTGKEGEEQLGGFLDQVYEADRIFRTHVELLATKQNKVGCNLETFETPARFMEGVRKSEVCRPPILLTSGNLYRLEACHLMITEMMKKLCERTPLIPTPFESTFDTKLFRSKLDQMLRFAAIRDILGETNLLIREGESLQQLLDSFANQNLRTVEVEPRLHYLQYFLHQNPTYPLFETGTLVDPNNAFIHGLGMREGREHLNDMFRSFVESGMFGFGEKLEEDKCFQWHLEKMKSELKKPDVDEKPVIVKPETLDFTVYEKWLMNPPNAMEVKSELKKLPMGTSIRMLDADPNMANDKEKREKRHTIVYQQLQRWVKNMKFYRGCYEFHKVPLSQSEQAFALIPLLVSDKSANGDESATRKLLHYFDNREDLLKYGDYLLRKHLSHPLPEKTSLKDINHMLEPVDHVNHIALSRPVTKGDRSVMGSSLSKFIKAVKWDGKSSGRWRKRLRQITHFDRCALVRYCTKLLPQILSEKLLIRVIADRGINTLVVGSVAKGRVWSSTNLASATNLEEIGSFIPYPAFADVAYEECRLGPDAPSELSAVTENDVPQLQKPVLHPPYLTDLTVDLLSQHTSQLKFESTQHTLAENTFRLMGALLTSTKDKTVKRLAELLKGSPRCGELLSEENLPTWAPRLIAVLADHQMREEFAYAFANKFEINLEDEGPQVVPSEGMVRFLNDLMEDKRFSSEMTFRIIRRRQKLAGRADRSQKQEAWLLPEDRAP